MTEQEGPVYMILSKKMKALDDEFGELSSKIAELSSKIHKDLTLQVP